jgi:hypothetical protein
MIPVFFFHRAHELSKASLVFDELFHESVPSIFGNTIKAIDYYNISFVRFFLKKRGVIV